MNANVTTTDLLTIEPKEFIAKSYQPFSVALEEAIAKAPSLTYEISTKAGMATAKEGRAMFRVIRIALEKKRAAAKAPIIEIGKLLDSRAKEIALRIEPFEKQFDDDITTEESRIEAEKAAKAAVEEERQASIQAQIDTIRNAPSLCTLHTSVQVNDAIAILTQIEINEEVFSDRKDEAIYLMAQSIQQMESMLSGKKAQEQLAAQMEEQRIENERAATVLAEQLAESERARRAALDEESKRQRIQAEELAKQRAELETMQRQLAEQQAEIERQRVAAANKAQLEAQAAQLALERAETARIESERIATAKMFAEVAKAEELAATDHLVVDAELSVGAGTVFYDHFVAPLTEAQQIEETRRRVQCAEYERPGNVVQLKTVRPSDTALVLAVAERFHASTTEAREWLNDFGNEREAA